MSDGRAITRSGTGEAQVEAIYLTNESDELIEVANVGQ